MRMTLKLSELTSSTFMKGSKACFHKVRVPPKALDVIRGISLSSLSAELSEEE